MKACHKCNVSVNDEYLFCPRCGADLRIPHCAACGKELPENAVFCPWCGVKMEQPKDQVAETVAKPEEAKPQAPEAQTEFTPVEPKRNPEYTGLYLSDIMGCRAPQKRTAKDLEDLAKLGAAFFGDTERILLYEGGDRQYQRLTAMTRFADMMEGFQYVEFSFPDSTTCSKAGCLSFNYLCYYGSSGCYDGGCGMSGTGQDHYFELRRITDRQYEIAKESREKYETTAASCDGWSCGNAVPYADQSEILIAQNRRPSRKSLLYLKNPMGIAGYFEIEND